MLRNATLKLVQAVPVIVILVVLTFLLMQLLPGDPAVVIAGPEASAAAVDAIRARLGLDQPIWWQLTSYFMHLLQGDFGTSLILNEPVFNAFLLRLPVTASLALVSMIITVPVGVALGTLAAYCHNRRSDVAIMIVALLGVSVPGFWIGILSVVLFSVKLGWLPSAGYSPLSDGAWAWLSTLVQPAMVLALFQIGYLARVTRSAMLDVLDQDFVRTARAKGMSEWSTVGKHALRNALIQVVTATGVILSLLVGGAVVIEQMFALPGIGRFVLDAILRRDYPVVQGSMLLLGIAFVLINLIVDIIYTWIDPRIRYD